MKRLILDLELSTIETLEDSKGLLLFLEEREINLTKKDILQILRHFSGFLLDSGTPKELESLNKLCLEITEKIKDKELDFNE